MCMCETVCIVGDKCLDSVKKGVPAVRQVDGVEITWHTLFKGQCPTHPNRTDPKCTLTYTRPRHMLR